MKIDNIQHLSTPKPVEQGRDTEKAGKAPAIGESGAGSVTHRLAGMTPIGRH